MKQMQFNLHALQRPLRAQSEADHLSRPVEQRSYCLMTYGV
jgi:hypothetical protein